MHWYQESFKEDYLLVYKHRNMESAERETEQIVRLLGIAKEELVLDVCCGAGRHAISLARKAFGVVGFDLSQVLLKHAQKSAGGLPIPFLFGDMRTLPCIDENFDIVLNLFTSFGYFEKDEDNVRVLQEIQRVLKPDGQFLLDYMNVQKVTKTLIPLSERIEGNSAIVEKRSIQGKFVCKEIQITDDLGQRSYYEKVRMYTESEMKKMMEKVGLKVTRLCGDWDGTQYYPESERMIFIGEVGS